MDSILTRGVGGPLILRVPQDERKAAFSGFICTPEHTMCPFRVFDYVKELI